MNYFGRFSRLLCVGAVLALAASLVVAAPQTGSAKVTQVRGIAYLGSAPANVGDEIPPGTMISTGPASEVLLNFGANGGYARILENTKLSIDELSVDKSGPEVVAKTKLILKEGKLESQVNKLSSRSSYIVQTPTSTAAIRGTTFTTYANGAVLVFDGCVDVIVKDAVTGREARFNVCANQMFDPTIPGVVPIPAGVMPPSFGVAGAPPPFPIGPTVFVSPTTTQPVTTEPTPPEGPDSAKK